MHFNAFTFTFFKHVIIYFMIFLMIHIGHKNQTNKINKINNINTQYVGIASEDLDCHP